MDQHHNWINGYAFWRGEYSVRNDEYNSLNKEYRKLQLSLAQCCGDNYMLQNAIFAISELDSLKWKKYANYDNEIINEINTLQSMYFEISRKFPYVSFYPTNPLEILFEIAKCNFPPTTRNEQKKIIPCIRKQTIYHRGKDSNGFEIVAIDCMAETNAIISDIRAFIEERKICGEYLNREDLIESDTIFKKDINDNSALKTELTKNIASYRMNSDESRAIGLLLFDYISEHTVTDINAIRAVRKIISENGPKNCGKIDSSERQFQRWLSKTKRCIELAEVLEI